MKPHAFIGRERELKRLGELRNQRAPKLVVVKGRRRIGKSRLIAEFAATQPQCTFWSFTGLAPQDGVSAQDQRDYFARQLSSDTQLTDWSDAFYLLSQKIHSGDLILFDEISWMGAKDPTFIPKLKAWWDQLKVPVILVMCGSVSTWIEENILKSTAFFGRVHLTLSLDPLSILESHLLLKQVGFQGSPYETFKLLSILGGVPWYLEQISGGQTTDDLLRKLCFEKDSLLLLEFDRIFHDLFNGKGTAYKKILDSLQNGMQTLSQIRQAVHFAQSGTLSQMMEHLITSGFVQKQHLWSFKTAKSRKQSLYRICDPYLRFYLKVIEPQRTKIASGAVEKTAPSHLPGFEAHLGLQMEHLLLQNRPLLLKAIGISPDDIVADGPYRQSQTTTQRGCQIDYLVQTKTQNLFICEFKFKRRELGPDIKEQVADKIKALTVPKGFAPVPVLFHIGGVAPSVETDGYFYRVIDVTDFL